MDAYWTLIDGIYNTSLSLFFFTLMFLMLTIGRKGWRANNRYGGVSSVICGICFLLFGFYNSLFRFFPYPYNGFMMWWILFNLVMNVIFALTVKRTIKKMKVESQEAIKDGINSKKTSILRRYILRMTKEDPYQEDITLKMEIIRKSFHLTGFLVLIAYFGLIIIPPVTQVISDAVVVAINQGVTGYNLIWGPISYFPYTIGDPSAIIDLTMMALMGSLVFAIISDIIRITWGPEYSIFNFLTKSMLRNKEKNAAGPQIYIMTGFIFSYMLYMAGILYISVFFAGILIACLSDAAAALIGRSFGKHKVKLRNNEVKSMEGFAAGVLVAYIIGLIFVGPIYAIIGAIIFLITDYLPQYTADNILNPIFIPIGFQVMIILLGLPVGLI